MRVLLSAESSSRSTRPSISSPSLSQAPPHQRRRHSRRCCRPRASPCFPCARTRARWRTLHPPLTARVSHHPQLQTTSGAQGDFKVRCAEAGPDGAAQRVHGGSAAAGACQCFHLRHVKSSLAKRSSVTRVDAAADARSGSNARKARLHHEPQSGSFGTENGGLRSCAKGRLDSSRIVW